MQRKVSVVIPSYNHEKYIESAVNSVLNQTYNDIEIVIIDDGSTDSSVAICNELARKHKQILFFSQENQGAHNTINKAIEKASGIYIAVLNSDDIFKPGKIERCLQVIEQNPKIEFISGKIEAIDEHGNVQKEGITVDWQQRAFDFLEKTDLLPLAILNENFIATTSNMFLSKKLWQTVGGFQALRYCHDLDFLMAVFRTTQYFFDKETTHIQYRVHPENTIKEKLNRVLVEIASVIAVSLVTDRVNLIKELNDDTIKYFKTFLHNKNISNLILLLVMLYEKQGDRQLFYEQLFGDEIKDQLASML